MAADFEGNSKKLRTRSPAYPYLDLRSALDKAATLWKAEGRHAAAVNVVMHHWGYKEDSSTGYSSMAALKKYGLIEHDGMGENKQIRLSDLALTILLDENADSPAHTDALRTAAMSPRIHAELWERYGADLPSDQSLKRYLVLEKNFNEAAVDELLAEYKQTISFAGLNHLPAPATSRTATTAPPTPEPEASSVRRPEPVAASKPPPRAIGPAAGTRSEPDFFSGPERRASGRDEGLGPLAAMRHGGNERRRPADRGPMRYEQDDFDQQEDGYDTPSRSSGNVVYAPPAVPMVPPTGSSTPAESETSSTAVRKELPVPLDGDRVALVPYPMTEEDFSLLIATLQLWKKRLVRAGE